MSNHIGFSNAMKEVTGNNFVTMDELKNDNGIYFPLFKNNADGTEAKKILGIAIGEEIQNAISSVVDELQTKVVNISGANVTIEIANNTIYNCNDVIDSLQISLPSVTPIDYISQINFESGSNPTVISTVENIQFVGDDSIATCKRFTLIFHNDGKEIICNVQGVSTK